ncbi:acyltransferase family protein [Microbispora catharanthi]|uniref:Acyltransferase family protein n=1 Tax=Microbispora catharanthi TaxID=1712871 RepID=A0A5N6BCQ6_9ACTN|nr:acyltransferase [Microbispora catharanthi]KAB8178326.1 acyltransferase family protein [Microbispora catharanthi]
METTGTAVSTTRLPSLTGMRIIAAGMIFFFHAQFEHVFADPAAQDVYAAILGQGGPTGVGFFFILSGFVLTWSARAGDTPGRFWRRRLFKVYPNHFVTFLVAALLLTWLVTPPQAGPALLNLFLLQAWTPNLSVMLSVNSVSWSLSCEAAFYLLFPFLLTRINRIRPERLWWLAGGLLALMWAVPTVVARLPLPTGGPSIPWHNVSQWEFWLAYTAPPVRALDFVLGMVMARIVLSGKWIGLRLGPAFALLVVGFLAAGVVPVVYRMVAVTAIPMALVIPAAAMADVRGTRSLLRLPAMVWLGDISFAFYLWHRLVLRFGHMAVGAKRQWDTLPALGMLLAALAVTIALSWLLYRFVEVPAMRRWSKPRRRPAGAVAPEAVAAPEDTVVSPRPAPSALPLPPPEG